jgi:GT2 family glycosyltransferase
MIQTRAVPAGNRTVGPTWVGLLDLEEGAEVVSVQGALLPEHDLARILVRKHRAPVGYVSLPTRPADTLSVRAWAAAEAQLAQALRAHDGWDSADSQGTWIAEMACPRHFPASGDVGVSIVVCTRSRPALLRDCLEAMRSIRYEPLEILVVDNAPAADETLDIVRQASQADPRVRYEREPRPGLSMARNRGVAAARFDIIAFTDDDVLVDPGWPAAIAAGFAADPHAACITGLVVSGALDTGPERYFDARYHWGTAFRPQRYDLGEHRHPARLYPFSAGIFGTGANFALRRSAIEHVGAFDPLLGAGSPGRGGEDLDLFLRLVLAGERICYVPAAFVWHRHRSDLRTVRDQIYSYGHGFGAYLGKHLLRRDLRAVMIGRVLRHAVTVAGQMRRASRASQLGARSWRLAITETRGLVSGIVRYANAARHSSPDEL